MIRLLQPLFFGSVAVAGHLAVFAASPIGIPTSTNTPAMTPAVQMAPAHMAAMVQQWTRAPEVQAEVAPVAPAAPEALALLVPVAPDTPRPLAPMVAPAAPSIAPKMDAPQIDTRPAAKPEPKPAPKVVEKPKVVQKAVQKTAPATAPAKVQKPASVATKPVKASAPNPAATKTMMSTWGKGITRAIAKQSRRTKGLGKGVVVLVIKVDTGGRLVAASVKKSSGSAALDKAALAAVGRASLPAAPKGMGGGAHRFTLPVASN